MYPVAENSSFFYHSIPSVSFNVYNMHSERLRSVLKQQLRRKRRLARYRDNIKSKSVSECALCVPLNFFTYISEKILSGGNRFYSRQTFPHD